MNCPLEQMALDAETDADVFFAFTKELGPGCRNRGERLWFLATVGLSVGESYDALGRDWCNYLERKYDRPTAPPFRANGP